MLKNETIHEKILKKPCPRERLRSDINMESFGMKIRYVSFSLTLVLFGVAGCSSNPQTTQVQIHEVMADQRYANDIPGVVQEVWVEPMVDVVDVPPGLDPEGQYYRPGHQAVMEIRQGRWRYHRPPNSVPK